MSNNKKLMQFLWNENTKDFLRYAKDGLIPPDYNEDTTIFLIENIIEVLIDSLDERERDAYRRELNSKDIVKEKRNKEELQNLWSLFERKLLRKRKRDITKIVYDEFYMNEIVTRKSILLPQTYEKLNPDNACLYWSYRIDRSMSWEDSWDNLENIGISVISMFESGYLDYKKTMSEFIHCISAND